MRIVVRGIPAAQGSKRHVGGGRMVESSRAAGPGTEAGGCIIDISPEEWL